MPLNFNRKPYYIFKKEKMDGHIFCQAFNNSISIGVCIH